MYTAIIVDDEQWVVKNLLDSIDWASHGFQIIGTETQSPKALEMITRLHPDLVFVDIRMPEISGLELMKRCNELQLDPLFIVVSGFAEFSYVQKCMNLGGIGYCLKPVEEEDVIPLLKKAKEILDERSAKDVPSVLDWVMEDTHGARERIEKLMRTEGFDAENGIRIVMCLGVDYPLVLRQYRHIVLRSAFGKSLFIVEESRENELYERLLPYADQFHGIGLSRVLYRIEDLKEAIEEAEMAAFQYFITGKPTVYQPVNNIGFAGFRSLVSAFQKQDMAEIFDLFKRYKREFPTGDYQIKHAFFLYNTVMSAIIQAQDPDADAARQDPPVLMDVEQLIARYQDVNDLIDDLIRMAVANLGGLYDEGQIRNDTFVAIIRYVGRHYQENISLQTLADEFYMNRNYISQLFIKHLSQSFTDYLAQLRIRHACELLMNSHLPIHRVGERSGYQDPYYFSKIFKKIVGKTPREYRTHGN